jgi:hypothetical protein
MQYSLKVVEFYPESAGEEKMLCIDDEGELFIGTARNLIVGKTDRIEVGKKLMGSCYRNITSWLDKDDRGIRIGNCQDGIEKPTCDRHFLFRSRLHLEQRPTACNSLVSVAFFSPSFLITN